MAAQPPGALLLVIAGVTVGQICIGAFFGRALAPLVDGQYSRDRTILGWHPMNPARQGSRWQQALPACGSGFAGGYCDELLTELRAGCLALAAIAASVGTATGVPLAAQALLPRTKAPPEGTRQLVALAAAFGNSFTLPAVFFMTLLPPALADRALGYAAIFMLFWSPALWSLGYAMVLGGPDNASQPPLPLTSPAAAAASSSGNGSGGSIASSQLGPRTGQMGSPKQSLLPGQQQQQQQQGTAVGPAPVPGGLRRISAGPDWEVVEGFEATQPISFSPAGSDGSAAAAGGSGGGGGGPSGQPHRHLAAFDEVMQYQVFRALRQSAGQVLNPPVLGILAGMAVGLTPWGRALLASVRGGGAAGAAGAALPPELGLMQAVLRHALEVVELLAQGTLAVQTLVLAASLLQQQSSAFPAGFGTASSISNQAFLPPGNGAGGANGSSSSSSGLGRGVLRAVKQALLPADGVEERALAVLSLTRFVLVPLGTLGLLWCLHALGLLRSASDPVLLFVLLVEAVMPSAQNLIILLQLSERTRKVAPSFAALLLKLYAYAVLPCTLWVTAFATRLAIPVVR
ncbi:hypothetical protein N2152v2_006796 [Parachlorella kessleri]